MMTTYGLDELAKALQSTLIRSQEGLDRKKEKRLRQTIIVDNNGHPEFLTWECRLPSGDGNEQHFEVLRLPWTSLSQTESLDITGLSVELNCKVRRTPRRKDKSQISLTATPINRGKAAEETTHSIKLSVSQQEPETFVSIDGTTIDDFLAEQLSPKQEQQELALKKRYPLTRKIIFSLICLIAAIAYIFLTP
jgi:hypothetical protein